MPDLPSPLYRVVFLALAGVWALAYILGLVLGAPNEDRSRRLARPAKLIMIGVVLACAALWLLATGGRPASFGWLILVGLLAGAVGDLLLADFFAVQRPEIAGMAAFGVGHALYLAAALTIRARLGAVGAWPVLLAAGLGAALAAGLWAAFIRNPGGSRALNTGSLVYGLLLGAAAAVGLEVWIETGRMALLAVGLLVFMASDLLLARYLIRREGFPSVRDVVWILYSAAQVMIAFSIGAAGAV